MAHPLDPIRAAAMRYPQAEKAFLFGDHEVYRVNKKVFLWVGEEDAGPYISVKLKETQDAALMLPFVQPASYGMAKWGWIGATFPKGKMPTEMVLQWLEESYRHTAPKKLVKLLDAERSGAAPVETKKPKAPAKKKTASAPKKKR